MQTMLVLILTVIFLLAAIIAMAFKVLFVKGGKFPEGHAHDLARMSEKKRTLKTITNHSKRQKPLETEL